jgi:DNA polymerase alpha subunit B
MIRDGDFDLPSDFHVEPDKATLNDLFRYHITRPLQRLTQSLPSISVILCPSIRDTALKHAAWPQDRLPKKELQLPKQVSVVTNPMTLSLNEIVVGISSADVLDQLRASSVTGGKAKQEDFLARLCKQLLEQRHFFPVFPPTDRQALASAGNAVEEEEMQLNTLGSSLDLSYLKLGEMYSIRPDVLVVPSVLNSFAKVSVSIFYTFCPIFPPSAAPTSGPLGIRKDPSRLIAQPHTATT